MRQRLLTFSALFLLIFLLIGLNAVSYIRKNVEPDSEFHPNRSTYNAGATGTRAFYDLLAETGSKPVRWQEKISALNTDLRNQPQTFVVIGALRKSLTNEEVKQLLDWVSRGGKLVVIDRAPNPDLISTTADWKISADSPSFPDYSVDPTNQTAMTDRTAAGIPAQPTIFTRDVNAVQPSKFASSIKLEKVSGKTASGAASASNPDFGSADGSDDEEDAPPPAPTVQNKQSERIIRTASPAPPSVIGETDADTLRAPVIHIAGGEKNLLADFPFGAGRVVFLSDPYIISNAGISLVDNARLAVNIVNADGGVIAFDEFHQGYGATQNELLAYFAETTVPAIFAQLVLLAGLLFFTQSRRFARPLPADQPNRLSKLEYVQAMAELQQRTKAYDLAVENIYTDFRRRAARFFGASNFEITRRELAVKIAERLKLNHDDIENLMRKAEEITYGEATNKREVLEITTRLRELEEKLNLRRARRQTFGR